MLEWFERVRTRPDLHQPDAVAPTLCAMREIGDDIGIQTVKLIVRNLLL